MIDLFGILISAMPFAVAALGLAGLGWSASTAGGASLAVAVLGAVVWPDLEATAVPGALFAGLGTSAQVLYVLFGGLLLYNLLSAGGAVDAVSRFLGALEPDRVALAAGIVVGVAPFFESVTGFGVAVVISVPILLAAGFTPLRAVALAGGWTGVRRRGAEAIVLGLVAGVGTLLTSLYLVPELSGAVGGLAATALFVAKRRNRLAGVPVRALLPYAFLLALLAAANGIAALRTVLGELGPVFDGPGLSLLTSGAFAALLLGLGPGEIGAAARRTATQWLPVAAAVLTFVLAGEVVAESGAAGLLAGGAEAFGYFFPAVSPVLAALGGCLTASKAASNALFMPLPVEAAHGAC